MFALLNEKYSLSFPEKVAEVRSLDFKRLLGAGILHTKMWLVDDEHFYLGSANMDWRSLTQVKVIARLILANSDLFFASSLPDLHYTKRFCMPLGNWNLRDQLLLHGERFGQDIRRVLGDGRYR